MASLISCNFSGHRLTCKIDLEKEFEMSKSPFLSSISDFMMVRRYSKRTVSTYLMWIKSFIIFHKKRHPKDMGANEIEAYLTHLAVNKSVASSTQSIALNALVFLYDKFLEQPVGELGEF